MSWKSAGNVALKTLRWVVVPLVIALALVFSLSVREWLATSFQAHPLWAAAILMVGCFAAAYLITANRNIANGALWIQFRDAGLILAIVIVLVGAGLVLTCASAVLATPDVTAAALRVTMLWAVACFMTGFLAGFLFGVPKVAGENTSATTGKTTAQSPLAGFAQRPNTNLEQISDWLTKIIVGLGLVELKGLPDHLKNAARWVAESLSATAPPSQAAISFAGSIILYFSIVGFLAGYLLTLLFLAGAFGRAGQQAYGGVASFGEDNLSDRIREFWRPKGGDVQPDNAAKIVAWIKQNLPDGTSITDLLSTKELEDARKKIVADLNIP